MKNITLQQSKLLKALSDLGLTSRASSAEIKKSFRFLAQKNHPDKGGDPDKFRNIVDAYSFLVNNYKERPDLTPIITLSLTYKQQILGERGLMIEAQGERIAFDLEPGANEKDILSVNTHDGYRIFSIKEIKTPGFIRHGYDLYATLDVDIIVAMRGGRVEMKGPCGEIFMVDIQPGVRYNAITRIKERGLFNKSTAQRGDLVIAIQYNVPYLTEEALPTFIERLTKQ